MSDSLLDIEKKNRRSDYGHIQTTERDVTILSWIGEQYAARFDHLQILAARYSEQNSIRDQGTMGYSGAQRLYRRWVKAGWVETKKVLAGEPQWIWLTKKGLKHLGLDYPYREVSITKLLHIHPTNSVRLYVEQQLGHDVQWISERQLNHIQTEKRGHMPDGELILQGKKVGIEVERSRKTGQRLERILRRLKMDYELVWYFAGDDCYSTIKNAVDGILGREKGFQIYDLTEIMLRVQPTNFRTQSTCQA